MEISMQPSGYRNKHLIYGEEATILSNLRLIWILLFDSSSAGPKFNHLNELDCSRNDLETDLQQTNERINFSKIQNWKKILKTKFILKEEKRLLWSEMVAFSCRRIHFSHCDFLFTFSIFPMCLQCKLYILIFLKDDKLFSGISAFVMAAERENNFLDCIIFFERNFHLYFRSFWFRSCWLYLLGKYASFSQVFAFHSLTRSRSLSLSLSSVFSNSRLKVYILSLSLPFAAMPKRGKNFHIKRFQRRYNEVDLTKFDKIMLDISALVFEL